MEGFRAASAWVEISTDLDGSQIERAARNAADRVDAELTEGVSRTGETISTTLGRAGESGGERMTRSIEGRIRDANGRFVKAGDKIGEGVTKGTEDHGKRNGERSFLGWILGANKAGTPAGMLFSESMIRAATPVAVALAPTLGAAMAGGIVGGLGIGTIGVGIALAMQDPRVKAAAQATGKDIGGTLKGAAEPFRDELIGVFGQARSAFARWAPDLRGLFGDAAKLMRPLSTGLEHMVDELLPGVRAAVANAEAPTNSLRLALERVGDAGGDLFSTMADDAQEGASAIDDLSYSVENLIRTVTAITHGAAQVKGFFNDVDVAVDKGRYAIEDFFSNSEKFKFLGWQLDLTADGFKRGSKEALAYRAAGEGVATQADFTTLKLAGMTDAQIVQADASGRYRASLDNAAGGIAAVRGAANGAIPGVRSLTEIMDDFSNRSISAEQAQSRLEQAIDDATAAAKRNGDGIDRNHPKQRANRDALIGIASAAKEAAAKILAETGSQEKASAASERGRKKFLEVADSMGVGKDAAIALANKLFGIPKKTEPKVTVADAQAKAAIEAIKYGIGTIHGKTVTVTVKYETRGSNRGEHIIGQGTVPFRDGGVTIHARDGFLRDAAVYSPAVGANARYAFAEPGTGGEAMVPMHARPGTEASVRSTLETAANWHGMTTRPQGGGGNHFHFAPGSIVLDASSIRDVADLVRWVENLAVASRTRVGAGAIVGSRV